MKCKYFSHKTQELNFILVNLDPQKKATIMMVAFLRNFHLEINKYKFF